MGGVGSTTAFAGWNLRPATVPDARETSTPAGMPILTGLIGSADGNSMRDWSDQIQSGGAGQRKPSREGVVCHRDELFGKASGPIGADCR